MSKVSLIKKIGSYVYPLLLEERTDYFGKVHRIDIYRNQIMLSTPSAIYSYGTSYYPFSIPLKHIKNDIPNIKSFLMLGTGLGSGLHILQQQFNTYPKTTLVDLNQTLLDLSKQYFNLNTHQNVEWICAEASHFVDNCHEKYNLIGLDLFIDMSVPLFAKSEQFLMKLHGLLEEKGILIFNVLFTSTNEMKIVEERLEGIFNEVTPLKHDRNNFYVCRR